MWQECSVLEQSANPRDLTHRMAPIFLKQRRFSLCRRGTLLRAPQTRFRVAPLPRLATAPRIEPPDHVPSGERRIVESTLDAAITPDCQIEDGLSDASEIAARPILRKHTRVGQWR